MRSKCNNPNCDRFRYYGMRGIECRIKNVEELVAHLGLPQLDQELDRIDNDGHYERGNIRWVSHVQNMQNRRKPIQHDVLLTEADVIHIYELRGKGATYARIAELMNRSATCIRDICNGRLHRETYHRFRAKLVA